MRRAALAALPALLLLAPEAPAQQAETYGYILRLAADTFAIESVSRTPDAVEGEIASRMLGRVVYRAALRPDGTVHALTARAWAPGSAADAAPLQDARLRLEGDTVAIEVAAGGGTRTQRIFAAGAEMIYVNPSMALMEQVLRLARAGGGARAEIPIFLSTGQTFTAVVTYPAPDSAAIAFGGGEMRVAISPDGRLLSGAIPGQNLTLERVEGPVSVAIAVEPPDYSAPADAPYRAEEVTVPTAAGHTLAGTLTRPLRGGRVPAVVMITGSGPQERDQAIPMVRGYRPFREIADTLSRRGIAVLRLDDRGTGASTGSFGGATSEDLADDIRAAVAYLRARPDVDPRKIALVGHSEGGMIAPMIAADDPSLAAIVLIAGPAHTGRQVIDHQMRQAVERTPGLTAEQQDSAHVAALEHWNELAESSPWIRYFLEHDPLPVARRVQRVPVLILHGETDRQVTAEQAELLAAAFREAGNRRVQVQVFPEVNHLLLRDPDGNPMGYMNLEDTSVVPEVRGALADWLARTLR
jgi:uncharacterized protein